jgi:hypothetical protein
MAIQQELMSKLALQLAETFSQEIYGDEGPALDTDIDDIEETAVLAARAAFDAIIAEALRLQNQKLPSHMPCPKCDGSCPVRFKSRSIQGRMGPAQIQEPICSCSACDRDFFPSAGIIAAR